jgi:hypothetical protein
MKYLVTALWEDGWTNEEEHPTLSAALKFIQEALYCDGILSAKIDKVPS